MFLHAGAYSTGRDFKEDVLVGSAGRSFRSREDGVPDFFALLGFQFTWGAEEETGDSTNSDDEPFSERGGAAASLNRLKYPSLYSDVAPGRE